MVDIAFVIPILGVAGLVLGMITATKRAVAVTVPPSSASASCWRSLGYASWAAPLT
jgi:hypothetical protein